MNYYTSEQIQCNALRVIMQLRDDRKLSDDELHDRRKQAVLLHKKGKTNIEISRLLGVHRNVIGDWISTWKSGGAKALKPKRRGVR